MTAPRIDTVMEALSAEQRMGAFTTGMLLHISVYIQCDIQCDGESLN
jgi:hypothetical protein